MILCSLSDTTRVGRVSPLIAYALDWLKKYDPENFAVSDIELDYGIVVKCEAPGLIPRERARLEAHRRYIDIHVPLKGTETIGWAPQRGLILSQQPYDDERDIAFYGDMAQCLLHVKPGQIAVFFPDDAHAPNIGIGNHRKLCIKIPVIEI